jgi:hypothetical protein
MQNFVYANVEIVICLATILQNSNKNSIFCLCECILNCLNGNVKLDPQIKEKLNKYNNENKEELYEKARERRERKKKMR